MSINSHPLVSTNLHDISPNASLDPETQPMVSMSTSRGSPFSSHIYTPCIMSKWNVLAYAVGHVLNDMSAACWFSYLLILLQKVQGLSSYQSGIVLLCGQLCDAIATPLVGIFSDASQGCPMLRLGRRQFYYVGGAMVVMINYFLVFGWCMPCTAYRMEPIVPTASNGTSSTDTTFYSSHDASILVVYYAIAASLFNVGWASVQVSHMSLVPELTFDEHKRVELNSARYAFTVGSNVLVFSVLFLFIHVLHYDKQQQFRYLAYVSLVVGITCSFFFLIGTHEQPARQHHNSQTAAGADSWKWYYWFRVKQFYRVGCVYMCTRLVVNVSQVFLPFYVTDVVNLSEVFITIIPCVVYVSSFVSAALMKIINQKIGRIKTFVLGTLLCSSALIGLFFITESSWILIFPVCILLGLGNATIMICSVQLEADLVDTNHASGAFVYGALSFTDKLSNGIAIFFLQYYNDDTSTYIRHCVCVVPLVACVIALAMAANIHWSLIRSGRNNEIVDQYCILEEHEHKDEEDQNTQLSVTHEFIPSFTNPWRRRSSAVTVVGQSE